MKRIHVISVLVAFSIVILLSNAVSTQSSCLDRAYFAYDDSGWLEFDDGDYISWSDHGGNIGQIYIVVEGDCQSTNPIFFEIWDTDDGSSIAQYQQKSVTVATPEFFDNKIIVPFEPHWASGFPTEPLGQDGGAVPDTTNIELMLKVWQDNPATNYVISDNWVVLGYGGGSNGGSCNDGNLNTPPPGDNADPFEPCDRIHGAFGDDSFFDGLNTVTQNGFDGGIKECEALCSISFSHACAMESAEIIAECNHVPPNDICNTGDYIILKGYNHRKTPSAKTGGDSPIDCILDNGVRFESGSCIFTVANTPSAQDVSLHPDGYYDMYDEFTYRYYINPVPGSCGGQTITSGTLYTLENYEGVIDIGHATTTVVGGSIEFAPAEDCTITPYFAKDATCTPLYNSNNDHVDHYLEVGEQVHVCVDISGCATGQGIDLQIYDTDNGVATSGSSITDLSFSPWNSGQISIPYYPGSQTWPFTQWEQDGNSDSGSFSKNDNTTEYMIKAVYTGVTAYSSNYVEIPHKCSDGTSLYDCSVDNPGKLCLLVGGEAKLVENCDGQQGGEYPDCSCLGQGTCRDGWAPHFEVNYDDGSHGGGTIQHYGGSATASVSSQQSAPGSEPNSLDLTKNTGGGYSVFYYTLSDLTSGNDYKTSAEIKTIGFLPEFARIYGKASGTNDNSVTLPFHSGGPNWEKLNFEFTQGSGESYNIMLQVKDTVGQSFFDDVLIEKRDKICTTEDGCNINSVTVTPQCDGKCGPGDRMFIEVQYSGPNCPSQVDVQVDFLNIENPEMGDPTCAITKSDTYGVGTNGWIRGMDITCNTESCNGFWTFPDVPVNCIGETMYAEAAGLYNHQTEEYLSGYAPLGGEFDFGSRPYLASVSANPDQVEEGWVVEMTGSGAGDNDNEDWQLECGENNGSSGLCEGIPGRSSSPTCSFTSDWSDNEEHTVWCRTRDESGFASDPERTTIIESIDEGAFLEIISPEAASWQYPTSFNVGVDWGIAQSDCGYSVKSNGIETIPFTLTGCSQSIIPIPVGPGVDGCRDEGDSKCEIIISGKDALQNEDEDSRLFSITFDQPSLVVSHEPQAIGQNIWYTITATASSPTTGVRNVSLYVTIDGEEMLPFHNLNCGSGDCEVYASNISVSGATVSYYAVSYDNAYRMEETTGTFDVCDITSASITSSCGAGACWEGDIINVNVEYDGTSVDVGGTCPYPTAYIQLDASDEEDECNIFSFGGDMVGIRTECETEDDGMTLCSGEWTIPAVPSACYDKTIYADNAQIWRGNFPTQTTPPIDFFAETENIVGNSYFYIGIPQDDCMHEGEVISNNSCVDTDRPYFCKNGVVIKNSEECGCPPGDDHMIKVLTGADENQTDCELATCYDIGTTDYGFCEIFQDNPTGMFCGGIPRGGGTNVINNVTLYPNAVGQYIDPACGCPPDQTPVSQPFWVEYYNNFENTQDIIFENTGGSQGSGGIFEGGYPAESNYAYFITKNNNDGESRARLPIDLSPGKTYTVTTYITTDKGNFARIYDFETTQASPYHTGSGGWATLQYTFNSGGFQNIVILSTENTNGTAVFDGVTAKRHDLLCTAICIDGTANGHCSDIEQGGWGQPYYCDQYAQGYPNPVPDADFCGCPEGMEPDGSGIYCVPLSCEPDGTPYKECSITGMTGEYIGGDHGILYCEDGAWQERPDLCGCTEGYGYDELYGTCVYCEDQINPPTGGYSLCEATNGTLVTNITVYNLTCEAEYNCSCPDGKIFDLASGCVPACNYNEICEPVESRTTCPSDCPVEWTNVETENTEYGASFSGDIDLMFPPLKVCVGNASVDECWDIEYDECSADQSCLCGNAVGTDCETTCHDREDVFYLFTEGLYLPLTKFVKIASDAYEFGCPVFHMDQLEGHLDTFWLIQQQAFINLERALIQYEEAETEEEKQMWQEQIDIYVEVLIVTESHIIYLEDVIEGVNTGLYGIEKVEEAFELTIQRYYEIQSILSGQMTVLRIDEINYPEVIELIEGQKVNVSIDLSISSTGNSTRWVKSYCDVMDPEAISYELESNCTELLGGTMDIISHELEIDKIGQWNITYCSLNASSVDTCASSRQFDREDDVGTINVTQFALLRIIDIVPPGEMASGENAIVEVVVENVDTSDHVGLVECALRDPSGDPHVIVSDNATIHAQNTHTFYPNMTVNEEGLWYVVSCSVYRLGSVINEGTVILNEQFNVGPPDFILSPITGTISIEPLGETEYTLLLKNVASSRETYTVTLSTTNDWDASFVGLSSTVITLNRDQSRNITVRVKHNQNSTNLTETTVTVESSSSRIKSSIFYIDVDVPNRPPTVTILDTPGAVQQGETITFIADITDPEGDAITANVCILNCETKCTMQKEGEVYTCDYTTDLDIGNYIFFINATDGEDITISDNHQLSVVVPGYCTSSSDCLSGQECRNGVCKEEVDCPGTTDECFVSSNGEYCVSCTQGYICNTGTCQQQAQCNRDEDCEYNERCDNLQCILSFSAICGDDICTPGEICEADCAEDEFPWVFIIAIVIMVVVGAFLFIFIRKRMEEEEEYE
ncbi:hypothetical protein ACFLQN_02510 [Candidatus Aenigmatarchaeota archaeon]